jgi:hypothetical protein
MNDSTNGLYFIADGTGGNGSEVARRLRALETNLTGSFLLLREAARRMMSSGGGSIVFCSKEHFKPLSPNFV